MSESTAQPDPLFLGEPTGRADLKAGTVYAISGEGGWIYYGQVTPDKAIGFFKRRDRAIADLNAVLLAPILSVVTVMSPSIGRALRSGRWSRMGRFPIVPDLADPRPTVQWPVGTLAVSVWVGPRIERETQVHDPAIQAFERAAAWDAEYHIPARLTADFGSEEVAWSVGGPIWRERRIAEEQARRSPNRPGFELPAGWVPTA